MMKTLLVTVAILIAVALFLVVAIMVRRKSSSTNDKGGGKDEFLKKMLKDYGNILLVIAAGLIFYLGIYSETPWKSPSFAEFVNRCRGNWFWVLIFFGILFVLIARSKLAEKTRSMLYWILTATFFFLFIVAPFWLHVTKPDDSPSKANQSDQLSRSTMPKDGKSEIISVPVGKRAKVYGDRFQIHFVYKDPPECVRESGSSGPLCPDSPETKMYFTNTADRENTVLYDFHPL